mmetsp:Transcript_23212/g.52350  ORF Transcript_23212/g.52350 Transcript_23212/m.52350 type:complete len:89 (+) Transcript_23212:90-356(+)
MPMNTMEPVNVSISGKECIALAKKIGRSQVPVDCAKYLDHVEKQNKAWEGASFKDRVSGTTSSATGRHSHLKLQRRLTNSGIQNHHAK